MKLATLSTLAALAGSMAAMPAAADIGNDKQPVWGPDVYGGYASDQVVVRVVPGLKPGVGVVGVVGAAGGDGPAFGEAHADRVLARWGLVGIRAAYPHPFGNPELAAAIGLDRYYLVEVAQGSDTPNLVRELLGSPALEAVEIVGIGGTAETIPNDPNFPLLWGMKNTGQNVPGSGVGVVGADVRATLAWDIFTGSDNITLAVIDSGVNINHADLAASIVPGWNTVLNNTNVTDDCPHGTHVAGTAAGIGNNGVGVAGVSWGAKIMPIKVLTGCNGTAVNCGAGIIWGADNGAHVETMSLQYYDNNSFQKDACEYAWKSGVVVIAATGNGAAKGTVAYPAKFPYCMGIGATNNKDLIAGFSNSGPEIDLSAPGVDVYSSVASGGYGYLSGTSMATPHVSGAACLLLSYAPNTPNDEIEQILRDSADDRGPPGWDPDFGTGRLNVYQAMQMANPGVFIKPVGQVPAVIPPGVAAEVLFTIEEGNDTLVPGSPTLHWRYDGGAYATAALEHLGGIDYRATLPAPACPDEPEYYISAEGVNGGTTTAPFGAPAKVYTAAVGVVQVQQPLSASFESGLPAGWTATGLWHVTGQCAPGPTCDGSMFAYYGKSATCNYDAGNNKGVLKLPPVAVPKVPPEGKVELTYCSNRETEVNPFADTARVYVNNVLVDDPEQSNTWQVRTVDLAAWSGQSVNIEFRFDTGDGINNKFRGWQVDNIQLTATAVSCTSCYADCDGNGSLNIDDFLCFQLKFALQEAYADCDGNSVFNIDDFLCFQLAFAVGC